MARVPWPPSRCRWSIGIPVLDEHADPLLHRLQKITPAHDHNDYERSASAAAPPMVNMMNPDGT
ncbi:MAG: hypothetical protein H6816_01370 [Phycisphaerales bacterium]|nr:hypothetical protein [Phycisphaerales bacterium]